MAPADGTVVRRSTRQRALVRELVSELDSLASAQEIHAQLRARGESVGLSTVYRTLQTLSEDAEIDSVRNEAGEVLYRQCSPQHHHHLVCRQCGRTVELTGPAVERWAHAAADEHGFTDVSHTVEIFGLCAECSAA